MMFRGSKATGRVDKDGSDDEAHTHESFLVAESHHWPIRSQQLANVPPRATTARRSTPHERIRSFFSSLQHDHDARTITARPVQNFFEHHVRPAADDQDDHGAGERRRREHVEAARPAIEGCLRASRSSRSSTGLATRSRTRSRRTSSRRSWTGRRGSRGACF